MSGTKQCKQDRGVIWSCYFSMITLELLVCVEAQQSHSPWKSLEVINASCLSFFCTSYQIIASFLGGGEVK